MSTHFVRAGAQDIAILNSVLKDYHENLSGVKVDFLFAERVTKHHETRPALNKDGRAIAAKIQITSLQDRARGIADAKLIVDMFEWTRLSDTRKAALLDHEVTHLQPVFYRPTKKNHYDESQKRDDLGRPMLKIRPHDWVITGFEEVVKRHGEASYEVHQFRQFEEDYGQLMLFDPAKFTKAVANREKFSKQCRGRHHKNCKGESCTCPCHGMTVSDET